MSFTNVPSSFTPSNTVANVDTQRTTSPIHVTSFSSENRILNWNWDESLPFADTLLSTFSALPVSNDNDHRGDLHVEVESSYGGLHYHTKEFLETLTSRDPSGFDDSSRTCSPIPLTCTSDGVTFQPQRVKCTIQNTHPDPIPRRALARVVDASSSENASMSVFHEEGAVTKTPQQFLNMYHMLNTLVNLEEELAAFPEPAHISEPQQPQLNLPANMTDELPSLPEPATISKPQEPLGQRMTHEEIEDTWNNLVSLNAQYGAQIPRNAVDALSPSAFLKQSVSESLPTSIPIIAEPLTHKTTNSFAGTQTPVGSGQGDPGFHLSPEMNEYMGEFQAMVPDVTRNHVHWENNHDISMAVSMEQLSAMHFNAAGDYLMNDTQNNNNTPTPSLSLGGNPSNPQPLIQSFASQLPTTWADDVQNSGEYPPFALSVLGGYTHTEGNVPEQAHFSEPSSSHVTHPASVNDANMNMTGWANNNHIPAPDNVHNTTWAQHNTINHSIQHGIPQGSSSHGMSSQPASLNPANPFGIVEPAVNGFQPTQNQYVPALASQIPQHIPFHQPPVTHPDHFAAHHPLQPFVPDTLPTPQTPQKRKREEDGENRVPAATPRPSKRQMLAYGASLASSAGPDIILPSVDSLPPDDHRRKEPYTKGLNKEFICQYPVGEDETCGVVIVLDRGQRNWKRHLRTHAKKEVQMLESGVIDINSEKIYALLWADKITVRCPDSDCTFSTMVWRTDGVLDGHLAKFHPDRYQAKMERQSQRGKEKGKENERHGFVFV